MKMAAREARKLIMNITYKCANRCVFCATGDRISAALGWDKIDEILRQHRDEGTDQLDIDGGEPTTHPRLVDAIGLARDLGYRSINVTTNGRLLRDRGARRAPRSNSGITHLLISLHGATAEVHEAATDAPGSFAQTIAGIDNVMALRPAHVETGMNVTIVRCQRRSPDAAHRAGDRQGILQDQLPVHDPVRSRLRGRRAAARRGRRAR